MSKEIDVRGLSCPQPVMLTKQAIDAGENDITVIADSPVAAENSGRMASTYGYKVETENKGDEIILRLTK